MRVRKLVALSAICALVACGGSHGGVRSVVAQIAPTTSPSASVLSDDDRAQNLVVTFDDLSSDWLGIDPTELLIGADLNALADQSEAEFRPCTGFTSQTVRRTGSAIGDVFTRSPLTGTTNPVSDRLAIESTAAFFRSSAVAKRVVEISGNARTLACERRLLLAKLSAPLRLLPNLTLKSFILRVVPIQRYADETVADLVSVSIGSNSFSITISAEAVAIRAGRAVTVVSFTGIAQSFPAQLEKELLAKVAAKLRADGGR